MKKILFTLILIFMFIPSLARSDQSIPNSVEEIIKQNARAEYPTDYKMQLYLIKKQKEAYIALKNYNANNIDYQTLEGIKERAVDEYQNKYDMQLYIIKKEVSAYQEIENINPVGDFGISISTFFEIKDRASAKYPGKYSMQLYEIKNQIKAYVKLNQ